MSKVIICSTPEAYKLAHSRRVPTEDNVNAEKITLSPSKAITLATVDAMDTPRDTPVETPWTASASHTTSKRSSLCLLAGTR